MQVSSSGYREPDSGEHPQSWCKMVRERLNEEETAKFVELRKHFDKEFEDGRMWYLSDNNLLRYLNGHDWDVEFVKNRLREAEEIRSSLGPLNSDDFSELISMGFFKFRPDCHDKVGRPILFVIAKNLKLKKVSYDLMSRYFVYTLDAICASMAESVDKFIMIVDFNGFGYGNCWVNHAKALIPFL